MGDVVGREHKGTSCSSKPLLSIHRVVGWRVEKWGRWGEAVTESRPPIVLAVLGRFVCGLCLSLFDFVLLSPEGGSRYVATLGLELTA